MAKASKQKINRSLILIVISFILLGIVARRVYSVYQSRQDYYKVVEEKKALEKQRKALQQEVKELKDDDFVIKYARDHYIFSKDGEEAIILPEE